MNAQPGKSRPVYVAGIKYKSVFDAAIWCGFTQPGLFNAIKKHCGAPCLVKRNFVVLESWVKTRLEKLETAI
jgi:hypothetical protein